MDEGVTFIARVLFVTAAMVLLYNARLLIIEQKHISTAAPQVHIGK